MNGKRFNRIVLAVSANDVSKSMLLECCMPTGCIQDERRVMTFDSGMHQP